MSSDEIPARNISVKPEVRLMFVTMIRLLNLSVCDLVFLLNDCYIK